MSTTAAGVAGAGGSSGIGEPVLEVQDLHVTFSTEDGPVYAVRGNDLVVHAGEVLGVVGESGSGKSVTMLAVMGLLHKTSQITVPRSFAAPSSSASSRTRPARCAERGSR